MDPFLRLVFRLVLVSFFLSGLTGLVYEILWTRMVGWLVGSGPFAVSIVLTVFMAGLGSGAFLAGRWADRVQSNARLLSIYALLELAIGVYALLLPALLQAATPFYAFLYNRLFNQFLVFQFVTFCLCAVLLGFPVLAMGATLPVLAKFCVSQLSQVGQRVGLLYGLNTLGAALGAALAGFWLIYALGLWGSLILAAALNLAIGLTCLTLARFLHRHTPKSLPPSVAHQTLVNRARRPAEPTPAVIMALLLVGVSGFSAMAYQVIWTRLLALLLGPTTYSLTVILVSFILGLALGSLGAAKLADRTAQPLAWLAFLQGLSALAALLVSHALGNSQLFFAKLISTFTELFFLRHSLQTALLIALLLIPTACLGAAFPLVARIVTRSVAQVGHALGLAYALNTVGAVLGAFGAGFILLPFLGQKNGLQLTVALQSMAALAVGIMLLTRPTHQRAIAWSPATLGVLGLMLCLVFPRWDQRLLAEGRYHRFSPELAQIGWAESLLHGRRWLRRQSRDELLFFGDGIGGFTTVLQSADALGNLERVLLVSGKGDASSRADMMTQVLLAHFPLLFHPAPRAVMVLGLASGITAGEVLHYPIDQLDVVDINPQMVPASAYFEPWNNHVLDHPKTRLILQDARAHLLLTDQSYDVIIAEPSNPWMAGLADLYTREFFQKARNRLRHDGIFVHFLHSYQMDWPTFALVCRTFAHVFPNSLLVTTLPAPGTAASEDYLLVGLNSDQPLALENAHRHLPYAAASRNVTLLDPRILCRLIVSEDLSSLAGPGPLHTDHHPLLESAAPRQMYHTSTAIRDALRARSRLRPETQDCLDLVTTDVDAQIDFAAYALSVYRPFPGMVDLARATPAQRERFAALWQQYAAHNPLRFDLIDDPDLRQTCRKLQISTLVDRAAHLPNPVLSWLHLGQLFQEQGQLPEAITATRQALRLDPEKPQAHLQLGHLFMALNRPQDAAPRFERALALGPKSAPLHNELGIAYTQLGRHQEALRQFTAILDLDPDSVDAHANLGIVLFRLGRLDEAIAHHRHALALQPDMAEIHNNLGVALRQQGNLDEAAGHFRRALQLRPHYPEARRNLQEIHRASTPP